MISAVRDAAHLESYHDAVQFWKMDEGIYERGEPPYGPPLSPEFCLGHWQTQCRCAMCPSASHCLASTGLCIPP